MYHLQMQEKKELNIWELINNGIDIIDHNKELKEKTKANEQKKTHTLETVANRFFELEKNNRKLKDDTIILSKQRLENHFFKYLPKKINVIWKIFLKYSFNIVM